MSLQVNCGYARTAIRELTSPKRGSSHQCLEKEKRLEDFRIFFDIPTFKLTDELFKSSNYSLPTQFDRFCEMTLSFFTKKWHPQAACQEYIGTFSISRWNELSTTAKESHSISNCDACYNTHPSLQQAYPGKPFYEPQVMVSLPPVLKEKN